MAVTAARIALVLLSLTGFWTLWGFPYQNGLLAILAAQNQPGAVLPGPTRAPMKQAYTHIGPVDKQLTVLVSFFYTAIDGHRADVSLSFLTLGGQVLAAWVLVTIESLRVSNQASIVLTATTLLGLGVAIVGYACVAPLWFALHLLLSPTVKDPKDYQLIVGVPVYLALAPLSIVLGFGLPSVLMCLPAPAVVSFATKQTWTAVQQGWPLWIGLVQLLLTRVADSRDPRASILTEADKRTKSLRFLRQAYVFAIVASAGSYLTAGGLSLLAGVFPVLFAPAYGAQLHPARIFWPVWPFGGPHVTVLADGALWFLQWDIAVGVTATLLWAVTVRVAAKHDTATRAQIVVGAVKLALLTAVLGPCGAAAIAMWSRDELIFRRAAASGEVVAKKDKRT